MRTLRFILGKSRVALISAVLVGAVSGFGSTALLSVLHGGLSGAQAWPWAFPLLPAFLGLCILVPVTRLLSLYLLERLGQRTVVNMRMAMSERILSSPLRDIERITGARLLATLTTDIGTISNTIVLIPSICVNGSIVIACLAYLAWLSRPFFLVLLGLMSVGVVTYQLPVRQSLRRFRKARRLQDSLIGYFKGLLEGIKEIKLHRPRATAFFGALRTSAESQCRTQIAANMVFGVAGAWGHLLYFVVIGALLFNESSLSKVDATVLTGYALVLVYMMTPLQNLLDSVARFSQANVALENIERLGISLGGEKVEPQGDPEHVPVRASRILELRGVTYTYTSERERHTFTLGPIDLEIRPGEITFVVGGNGSGKTTLAKIITGLYTPDAGEILADGQPITDANRESYCQLFTAVFADYFVFDRLFGLTGPDLDEQARVGLRKLQLDHCVEIHDGVFSNIDLSYGQQKRLALLTATLEGRPICVFDEWAANQDPVFKKFFYFELLPQLRSQNEFILVISHDDRYFHLADRIVKLDSGRISFDAPVKRLPSRRNRALGPEKLPLRDTDVIGTLDRIIRSVS